MIRRPPRSTQVRTLFPYTTLFRSVIFNFSLLTIFSQELNEHDYIKLEITNKINFQTQIDSQNSITKFDINSFFFPTTYNQSQYLNNFSSTFDNYLIKNDNFSYFILFDIKDNLKQNNEIKNTFILESTTHKPEIKNKIYYPTNLQNIKQENEMYTQFGDLVDIDNSIKNKANELANGQDDLFLIATKIANYITKDINYNLTTIDENPNQKSSEVFVSKQGVCKEITNLYVSMMRSLDIPTRFVTGYAYTTSEDLVERLNNNWGGHVWAEVLIGDTWVPFDLTYHQYGFVDSTHIITDKSQFIRNNGVTLDALSYGVKIVPNSLKLENSFVEVDKKDELFDNGFDIQLSGPDKLGIESFGYIKATVKNTKPYYQNLFLKFARPSEVEYIDENENIYIFKPNEEKEIYFKYKIDELDSSYIYTFPFLIYNDFIKAEFKVEISKNNRIYQKLELPKAEEKKVYFTNNNVNYNCDYNLKNENIELLCTVKNPNNYQISNFSLCYKNNCNTSNLLINEEKKISFQTLEFPTQINSKYEQKIQQINLNFNSPKLIISHNQNYQKLNLSSQISNYKENLKLKILIDNKIAFDDSISNNKAFDLNLKPGIQNLKIQLYYGDVIFDNFESQLNIEKTPLLEKIKNLFKSLF